MCLNTVNKEIKVDTKFGYKFFRRRVGPDGEVFFTGFWSVGEQEAPIDKWITDNEPLKNVIGSGAAKYRPGFHIFLAVKGARRFQAVCWWYSAVLKKVQFSRVVATGSQYGKVVVARRFKRIEL